MNITDTIINYIIEKYQPYAIIAYGSFADGSANANSDFDALVITENTKKHDASVIENTVLDVFVYPMEIFQSEYNPEEFVQVAAGKILLDKSGIAKELQKRVLDYIENTPPKSKEEIQQELDWCEKMLLRTLREDTEGYYRWHWILIDSLEIYFDIKGLYYYGPKKALRYMEKAEPEAFEIYSKALKELNWEYLSEWVSYLKRL